jgi:hypothetical protein
MVTQLCVDLAPPDIVVGRPGSFLSPRCGRYPVVGKVHPTRYRLTRQDLKRHFVTVRALQVCRSLVVVRDSTTLQFHLGAVPFSRPFAFLVGKTDFVAGDTPFA